MSGSPLFQNRFNSEKQNLLAGSMYENIQSNPKFAYLWGFFAADGCLYRDSRNYRFEFYDGSSVKEELHYSRELIESIRKIVLEITGREAPIRQRGNLFVLHFRNKHFAEFLIKNNFAKPGAKTFSVDIDKRFQGNLLEKYFWLGFMDGDGTVARDTRKVAAEVKSKQLMESFRHFLDEQGVLYHYSEREVSGSTAYRVNIGANFIYEYYSTIGFLHPRKRMWLEGHLKKQNGYIQNRVRFDEYLLQGGIFDYSRILNSNRVYIVNGKELLQRFGAKHAGCKNKRFLDILRKLTEKGMNKEEIFELLSKYRWKMSKGSTKSVKLPFRLNKDIEEIASLIRFNCGSMQISRLYTRALNKDPEKLINKFVEIFDIKPTYTGKGEPLFCSCVL